MTKSRNLRNDNARAQAIAAGDKHYWSGIPCRHGHKAKRLTSNGSCLECVAINRSQKDKKYYQNNVNRLKEYQKSYRTENSELVKIKNREKWLRNHAENLEKLKVRSKRCSEKRRTDRQYDSFMAALASEEAGSC